MKIVMWKRMSYAFAVIALMAVALVAKDVRTISMRDECDPASFNAAVGPGTCVGDGDVTFAEFIDALADGGHEKWRFNDSRTEADVAANAKNEGGETHSFTPVKEFGGGIIDALNMGQKPAPECVRLVNGQPIPIQTPVGIVFVPSDLEQDTEVAPGEKSETMPLMKRTNRFQCCIHPWMRSTVTKN